MRWPCYAAKRLDGALRLAVKIDIGKAIERKDQTSRHLVDDFGEGFYGGLRAKPEHIENKDRARGPDVASARQRFDPHLHAGGND